MSDVTVYIGPLFLFFVIAGLAAAWQSRHPQREIEAREKILSRNWRLPRWRQMPKWESYRLQQRDPEQFTAASTLRARFFTAAALATLIV